MADDSLTPGQKGAKFQDVHYNVPLMTVSDGEMGILFFVVLLRHFLDLEGSFLIRLGHVA